MTRIAKQLNSLGYWLRSGGAKGADTAFEEGAGDQKEIFTVDDCTHEAFNMASTFHPSWHHCNHYVRLLHGRNCMIIMGRDLKTPVEFVVCWQDPNLARGGTRLGMMVAENRGIPIYNLCILGEYERLTKERLNQ